MLQLAFVTYRKGSYILVENKAENDRFFIIQSGRVQIHKENKIVDEEGGNVLGPGDFIGVVACMSGHSQIETAVAVTDVIVISVRRAQYPELIEKNAPIAMKIIFSFAHKLRYINEALMRLTLKHNAIPSLAQLYAVAEYYESAGKNNLAMYGYYQYLKACPQGEYVPRAKKRFVALKACAHAVYLEPSSDLMRKYPRDTMIFSEFQSGQDMYIIQSGQVKITKVVNNNEVILAVLKKGDFFGEMALLENKPRSASAIAHEDCSLMTVNRKNFDQMVASQPQLIARLTTTLAERLWNVYMQLGNTLINDPFEKLIDMLSLQLEKYKSQFSSAVPVALDITPSDLADMCGIPRDRQDECIADLLKDKRIRINESGRLLIAGSGDFSKQAAYYRKLKKT